MNSAFSQEEIMSFLTQWCDDNCLSLQASEDLWNIFRLTGIDEFIRSNPMKDNTEVLDRLLRFALHEAQYVDDLFTHDDYVTLEEALTQSVEGMKKTPYTRDEMAADYFDPLEDRYTEGWNDCLEHIATNYPNGVRIKR
jgi:hypothetical protein